ncbi:MAG TPA: helix-turn-helix transcriptional regulator [Stellaceae bacterium]|jgi:DNA-binding CsgD family transcriptional regulator
MAKHAVNNIEVIPELSCRQRQILQCLIMGFHNKTIANYLHIEVVTVKMHIGVLFRKLGVTNRTEAAVRGIRLCVDGSASNLELPHRERRGRAGGGAGTDLGVRRNPPDRRNSAV